MAKAFTSLRTRTQRAASSRYQHKKGTTGPKTSRGIGKRPDLAQEWTGSGLWHLVGEITGRCVFARRHNRETRTLDDKRDRRQNGCVSGTRAGAMEEFRRKNDFWISVPASGQIHGQAAGTD